MPLLASLTQTDQHWGALVEAAQPLDVMALRRKSLSLHRNLMFTRSLYQTADMHRQGELLQAVAAMVDEGLLRTTVTQTLSPINAGNPRRAHALAESGRTRGKLTLAGWA